MSRLCLRCVVSGRVQGVWFRGAAREKACELGVSGYAVNRPDGTVEVLAVGPAEAVSTLVSWLEEGPPMARVAAVETVSAEAPEGLQGFHVR